MNRTRSHPHRALQIVVLAAGSLMAPHAPAADTPTQQPAEARAASVLGDNAALRYWPAFHLMPRSDDEQWKLLDDLRATPANDPAAKKLIDAAGTSLRYLHDGARVPNADWGLEYEQGFALLLPHAQGARNLSRIACLRAHQRALAGDPGGAADDLADAMTLARHVSPDGILITLLVRYAIESAAIDTAGDHLLRLKGAPLDHLSARLDRLPPSASVRDSVRIEREFGQRWVAKEIRSWPARSDLRARLTALFGGSPESDVSAEVDRLLKAGGGTAEGVAAQVEALGTVYDELDAALALPGEQARRRVAEIRDRAAQANPVASLLLPAYGRSVDVEARATARVAMLKAAIAIVQGGEGKLNDVRDPFGDGPFEYKPAGNGGGGFELKSKLVVKGNEPVTLRVGMPLETKKP